MNFTSGIFSSKTLVSMKHERTKIKKNYIRMVSKRVIDPI